MFTYMCKKHKPQTSPNLSFLTVISKLKIDVSISILNRWNKDIKTF